MTASPLLEKAPGFGVSQFMEDVRYQHALEMELAQTIASMQPVAGARVNLAEPRQSVFVSDNRTASASVFVQLKAGRDARARAGAGHRQPGGLERAESLSRPGDRRRPAGTAAVRAQRPRRLCHGRARVRHGASHGRPITRGASRRSSRRSSGPGLVHAQVVAELNLGHQRAGQGALHAQQPDRAQRATLRAEHAAPPAPAACRARCPTSRLRRAPSLPPPPRSRAPRPPKPAAAAPARRAGAAQMPARHDATARRHDRAAWTAARRRQRPGAPGGDTADIADVTRNYEIDRTAGLLQPAGRYGSPADRRGADRRSHGNGHGRQGEEGARSMHRGAGAHHAAGQGRRRLRRSAGRQRQRRERVVRYGQQRSRGGRRPTRRRRIWQTPFAWSLLRIVAGLVVVLVLVLSVLRPLVQDAHLRRGWRLAAPGAAQALPARRRARRRPLAPPGPKGSRGEHRHARAAAHPGAHAGESGPEARRAGGARLGRQR